MHLLKRYKAWRNPPERKLRAIQGDLTRLENQLLLVIKETQKDAFKGIVEFFNITSPWHDSGLGDIIAAFREVNDGQYDSIIKELATLDDQFARAGRYRFGTNRTGPGEIVTAEDVWLGNIYGLFTLPVSEWSEHRRDDTFEWNGHTVNVYDAIAKQARDYVMNHAPIMVQRVHALANA